MGEYKSNTLNGRMSLPNQGHEINTIIDYYAGAYGPTIRIWSCSKAPILALQNACLNLSSGAACQLSISDVLLATPNGMGNIFMKLVPSSNSRQKSLILYTVNNSDKYFEWCMNKSGWKRIAALIDGLLRQNLPRHQYLTIEGIDDALIELSYNE